MTLHGDPALALEAELDGVHLAAGTDPSRARALLGPGALIGISVHATEEAHKLDPNLFDYAIAGPVYASASKPDYGPALGQSGIGTICRATPLPMIAIGGIAPATVAKVLLAGAAGIAVMGGIMRAQDPKGATAAVIAALQSAMSAALHPRAR